MGVGVKERGGEETDTAKGVSSVGGKYGKREREREREIAKESQREKERQRELVRVREIERERERERESCPSYISPLP